MRTSRSNIFNANRISTQPHTSNFGSMPRPDLNTGQSLHRPYLVSISTILLRHCSVTKIACECRLSSPSSFKITQYNMPTEPCFYTLLHTITMTSIRPQNLTENQIMIKTWLLLSLLLVSACGGKNSGYRYREDMFIFKNDRCCLARW